MIRIYKYEDIANTDIFIREDNKTGVEQTVAEIIADVRENKDKALFKYCEKFDNAKMDALQVTNDEIDEAFAKIEPKFVEIIKKAAENIRAFHSRQVRSSLVISENKGIVIGQKVIPIEKVGLYVP
ncbi:MAG: histidinol dehydrogenase, partial [Bacillota bacterium]|nr:histidinol dehydrogenase [Bacillota bacterium]